MAASTGSDEIVPKELFPHNPTGHVSATECHGLRDWELVGLNIPRRIRQLGKSFFHSSNERNGDQCAQHKLYDRQP